MTLWEIKSRLMECKWEIEKRVCSGCQDPCPDSCPHVAKIRALQKASDIVRELSIRPHENPLLRVKGVRP